MVMHPSALAEIYRTVRAHTAALAAPLSAEDCGAQSMPDTSPTKWHLGHTSWFFETFVLERWEPNFQAFDPAFRILFNSYYNAVGDKHPRPQRGLLTRPPLDRVYQYRADVDRRMQLLLASANANTTANPEVAKLVELGLHHEQQHQELLLTDIQHLLFCNPLLPAYLPAHLPTHLPADVPADVPDHLHEHDRSLQNATTAPDLGWTTCEGRVAEVGHAGPAFSFDNEGPRHRVFLQPYRLANRLVTNGEYARFIAEEGYDKPEFWLAEGWDWRVAQQRAYPLYWHSADATWHTFTLGGLVLMDPRRPVVHVSYFEADAYARWARSRLPTEAEWEHAAVSAATNHSDSSGDSTGGTGNTGSAVKLQQLFGEAWQWTASSYAPYPGFHTDPGAVGEYNGKFMVNQYVLRGSSSATPAGHARATYRNFFPASACWQFSGIRLAQDLPPH